MWAGAVGLRRRDYHVEATGLLSDDSPALRDVGFAGEPSI